MRNLLLLLGIAPALFGQGPMIGTLLLPSGGVGSAYSEMLLVGGGTRPYKWSVTSGTLPAGLDLNQAQGLISGVPTAPGLATFIVKVTDKDNLSDSQQLSIRIDPAPLSVTTTSLPDAT